MKIPSAPQRVTLNITNRCNLNCVYCAVCSSKNDPCDLDLEEWWRVIDELARIKVFNLVISGGEPFVRPDLEEILKRIFQYHFRISINTNGTVYNRKVLSLLAKTNRLDNIQVSLDGPDARIHDRIRGRGSFNKILNYIENLNEFGIPFSFNVVVTKQNMEFLGNIIDFAKKSGADQVSFSPLSPQGAAISHLKELGISFKEERRVETVLRRLEVEYPGFAGGNMLETFNLMDNISHMDPAEGSGDEANLITSCGGSVSECAIRPEGWVIPCDRLWDYRVGNIKEESFQYIWIHSDGFKQFRERYSRTMDSFEECRNCLYTRVCRGGCPAVPYNLGKGIEGWDPFSCYMVYTGQKESYV